MSEFDYNERRKHIFFYRIEIFTNIIFGILKHLQNNIPVKLRFYLYLILKQKVSDIFTSN